MDRSGNRVGYPYQLRNPYTAEPTSRPTNTYGNQSYNDGYNSGGNPYNNSRNNPYNVGSNANNSGGNTYNSGNNLYNARQNANNSRNSPLNPYNPGSNASNLGANRNIPGVNPFSQEPMKMPSQTDAEKEEQFRKLLLKPQPKVLGTVQIFVAFMQLALGTVIILSEMAYNASFYITLAGGLYVNFWGIPFFLVSGSLSITAEVQESPSLHLLKSYMAMNILSSIESLIGLGGSCFDVYNSSRYRTDILTALMVFSVIINLLEFCVAVSLTHFARLAISLKYGGQVSKGIFKELDFENQMSRISDLAQNAEGLASMVNPDTIEGITSFIGGDPSAFMPEDY